MATQLSEQAPLPSAVMLRLTLAAGEIANVSAPFLRSPSRRYKIAHTRFAIMLVAREYGKRPSTIGHFFGRDHSSVLHGITRARQLALDDENYADLIRQLRLEVAR